MWLCAAIDKFYLLLYNIVLIFTLSCLVLGNKHGVYFAKHPNRRDLKMQHPFFKETAEEMVERLCVEFVKREIFNPSYPVAKPAIKACLLQKAKDFDITAPKRFGIDHDEDRKDYINVCREEVVWLEATRLFSYWHAYKFPPRPIKKPTSFFG